MALSFEQARAIAMQLASQIQNEQDKPGTLNAEALYDMADDFERLSQWARHRGDERPEEDGDGEDLRGGR